ncbi:integral membrane family protein (plasmid) [Piscirickettsia salmonis]|nr:integral membrane family protein [Piscirickettsia salmonis]APS49292.1 integral membrane family protein [Piscirickettsia salmonis]
MRLFFSTDYNLSSTPRRGYKYASVFFTLYLVTVLSTEILATRFTDVFGYIVPGGIFIFPLTFVINDIAGEVYGYAEPKKYIWLGFLAEIIFAAVVMAVAHADYPATFTHAKDFQVVLDPTFRYAISSLMGIFVGEFLNIYILSKLKILTKGKKFPIRFIISNAIGQLFLSIVVDTLIFFGKVDFSTFLHMVWNGYVWKMAIALIFALPAWLLIIKLKRAEGVDVYDHNVNYNPFSPKTYKD